MSSKTNSVEKSVKHIQDVLNTFNYLYASVTPIYGNTLIDITIPANTDNPVNRLSIVGSYSVSLGVYRIEAINLFTQNEDFFFQTLKTLHTVITNLQVGLDNANKNK
jgi:hypothetical protein